MKINKLSSEKKLQEILNENVVCAENYKRANENNNSQSVESDNQKDKHFKIVLSYKPTKSDTNLPQELIDENETSNEFTIPVKPQLKAILSSMIDNEEVESGICNPSEKYFLKEYEEDHISALNELSVLFMDNYELGHRKAHLLVGILHILSHMKYEDIYPLGQYMAMIALQYSDREVQEYGIKCFENWDNVNGISKLKAVQYAAEWLEDYANDVINTLEGK